MHVCFTELESFTEEVLRVTDEDTLWKFKTELATNPEQGNLIRHSGGLRKTRMKLAGRGKSNGARVIYLWLPQSRRFVLLTLYTKSAQANLSPMQLTRLQVAVETLKKQYSR